VPRRPPRRKGIEEFQRITTEETNPTSEGFFAKLKKMFEA
jgi:molecular chaperone DnaJ